ncbi:MAG: hypothetical protein RBU30_16885 [Polyangia bacterium]|jgi:hypothetical protein|nr:hypothetical protein [Polyangia bacterium]
MPENDRLESALPEASSPDAPKALAPERVRAPQKPKTLPLWIALVLLAILPAVGAGVWFGGRLHRVDDRPPPKPRVSRRAPRKAPAPALTRPTEATGQAAPAGPVSSPDASAPVQGDAGGTTR